MGRFLAFILGVAGAVIASQGPSFTLQYMQNLEGRIDELGQVVANWDSIVDDLGTNRDGYIADLKAAGRESTDKTALEIQRTYDRYEYLTSHRAELEQVADYIRPVVLARGYDRGIASSVRQEFKPAVPTTIDGAIYAAGGFAVAWGLPLMLFSLIGGMFGGRR